MSIRGYCSVLCDEATLRYPAKFLQTLELCNRSKDASSPEALILLSSKDWNLAFSHVSTQHHILEVAKTHRVGIQVVHKIADIKPAMERHRSIIGKQINLLEFHAHGTETFMDMGEELLTERDIKKEDLESLDRDGIINLLSCETGLKLAQKIADITCRKVFAPMIIPQECCFFSYCQDHHTFELTSFDGEKQIIGTYEKDREPSACQRKKLCFSSEMSSRSFYKKLSESDEIQFLEKNKDNPYALLKLAQIQISRGEKDKIIEYLEVAISKGCKEALYELGMYYYNEGDTLKAFEYCLKASEKGMQINSTLEFLADKLGPDAQFKLSYHYVQKNEMDNYLISLRKAALKGHSKSQIFLSRRYYRIGDKANAFKWFINADCSKIFIDEWYESKMQEVADELGPEAQFKLSFHYVQKNEMDKYLQSLQKAASKGHLESQMILSRRYYVIGDKANAFKWFIIAGRNKKFFDEKYELQMLEVADESDIHAKDSLIEYYLNKGDLKLARCYFEKFHPEFSEKSSSL